jgi:putative hydrolase
MNKILADMHTHTIASGHAYATLTEMCKEAANKGLEIYGITEHSSGIPGTCADLYFKN